MFAVALAALAAPAAAATATLGAGAPPIQNYSFRDYNSGGQVWTVLQDRHGLIYLGNSSSVISQFDGVTWRKIYVPGTVVRSLATDAKGTIWVGANENMGYLAPDEHGALKYHTIFDKVPADHRGVSDVWQVLPTEKGVFFRAYEQLYRWDGQTVHAWSPAPGSRFQAISEVRGHIYTAQDGVGMQEVVGDDLVTMPGTEVYKNTYKLFFYPYDEGRILATARDGGITLYDGQKVTPFATDAEPFFKQHKIYNSTMLRDGRIVVNTLSGGAVILGHDGKLQQILNKEAGLLGSDILSSYEDRDGALWIGTSYGVSRVEINSPITVFSHEPALDVLEYKGTIYVSGYSGKASVAKSVTDPVTHQVTFADMKGPSQSWNLVDFKDPSHPGSEQLLVATSEGAMRMQGNELVPLIPSLRSIAEQCYAVVQSKKDPSRIFLAHSDSVQSFRWDGSKWLDEGRLAGVVYEARNVAEDDDGTVFISGGTGKILLIHLGAKGMGDAHWESLGSEHGLEDGSTDVEKAGGQIWVTVDRSKHIFRWDRQAQKFVVDDTFALPVDAPGAAYGIIPVAGDRVWSGTTAPDQRRLGRFTRLPNGTWALEEDAFRELNRMRVFNFRADEPDGPTWANGDGVFRYTPRGKQVDQQPFTTAVREVRAGDKTLFGGEAEGMAAVKLPPGSDALQFRFAASAYSNPAETMYQYTLEGVDRGWSPWEKQTEANYSGLGPGSYTFRVRSRTDDGRLGQEGSFAFTILPPWYRTALAYIAYVLLALLLIYLAWRQISAYERSKARRKTKALQEQARALEATVNERTQEIRAQAAELAEQKESIELLSEIGREITASLDLNTILFKLYERVNQIVDASIFGVGLYRPEKKQIEYSLAIENGKRYAPYTRSTEDKNQFAVWCVDHRQPILINDVANEYQRYIKTYEHGTRTLEDGTLAQPPASMIYLPLIAQERLLGVLSIQSFKKNAYTERHLSLLENLASYTTIALDNANAYQTINQREREVSERAAELITINNITQALATQLDKDKLIQLVGDQVRDLFHAPIVYVALLDRSAMMLHFPYTFGEEAPSRPFGAGLTSQIIRAGKPLLINEDMEGSRSRMGIEQIGRNSASYLGVPIPSGGEIVGVLSVQSTEQEGRFTGADQRLLSTIASAVGVALHNARLFEETRLARAAAEEADAAKSSFLSTVSHELRTPLTSVLGFAKIIRRRLEERLFPLVESDEPKVEQTKQQVLENLGVVVSEGERLTKLIDDVLDLAKIEAGKLAWNMAPVSAADIIDRAVSATASLFEAKKLKLEREIQPDLPLVTGDQDRLIQVVINLISNAVKFTEQGSIKCAARQQGGELIVSVTDSGIGIAPADQPKVFEKFKQVGDTLTDKPKGTGLGLPICKEIVEYHGGRIWVESAAGHGSTFAFTLPVRDAVSAVEPPPRRRVDIESLVKQLREKVDTHQPRDKSVLVVDDDANIRSLLKQELGEAGYRVRLAEDGRKALTLIREETPGLVILDVMMPEMNGFDVAAVLKNDPATMDIPIIILSILEDKERGYRLGVDRYLTKPIDTASLFHEVDALLGQGKSKRKVMIVDEDTSTVRTISDVLEARGYQVVDSNGSELLSRAVTSKPDIIILNSLLSNDDAVRALRFEKGMENVLFLIYQ